VSPLSAIGWGTLTFALATLISRITGLIRDVVLAHYFGTSGLLDAYFLAILIPFYLRRIFAEGAMASAFVPIYASTHNTSKSESNRFASAVTNLVLLITIFVSLALIIFSKPVLRLFATGFTSETLSLSSSVLRFTAFYVVLVSLSAVFSSIANFHGRFFLPALAPMFINLCVVATAFIAADSQNVKLLGIGFLIGGILQLILSFLSANKDFQYSFIINHDRFHDFSRLFFTASIGYAVTHINSIVDTNVSTWLGPGSVSSLQYALRLFQLPIGLFGVAVSTAALPSFSRNLDQIDRSLKEALELLWFLVLPASIAMALMAQPLIFLIFQHGTFDSSATETVSRCLVMYSLGIPFYTTYLLLSRYYHAQQKGGVPSIVTLLMVLINVALDVLLAPIMGIAGVALATSVSGGVGALVIWRAIKKRSKVTFIDHREFQKLLLINIPVLTLSIFALRFASTRVLVLAFVAVIVLSYLLAARYAQLRSLKLLLSILSRKRQG